MFLSVQRALLAVTYLNLIVSGQVLDSLPLDDGTKKYLESLPSDQLEAILKIYGEATAGQVPASAEIIEAQELRWSYNHSPPFYPTPRATAVGDWESALDQALALVSQMTIEEKVAVVSGQTNTTNGCAGMIPGVPRLGFPGICISDGPNGLHGMTTVDGYASGITVGASWNKRLALERGYYMGLEAKAKGVNNLLGPTVGPLGRTVMGGRNWESFSVDPYLCGSLGAETVRGLQKNVIATAKHFIVNEQETNRNPSFLGTGNASVSAFVDDRTMHELYLWPFQDLVKAGVGAVMCSYNRINGSHGCQNSYTQNYLLKKELAFKGYVISDNGALHTGVAAANAGMDITTPFDAQWGRNLSDAIANGTMDASRLDDMVARTVAAWIKLAKFEPGMGLPLETASPRQIISGVSAAAQPNILQNAVEGIVLVKNRDNALPLRKPNMLALYGYDGRAPSKNFPAGPNTKYDLGFSSVNVTDAEMQGLFIGYGELPGAAYLGTLVSGGGSASSVPAYIDSPYAAFQRRAKDDGTFLIWDFQSQDPSPASPGTDACLVFINEFAAEGQDRSTVADSWSDQLIMNVAAECPNTIVSIHNSGTRLVDRWIENPNVTAVLFAHLPGQDAGQSLVDIIYGEQAPSGRLPYTVAKNESDYGELLHPTKADNSSNYYTWTNLTEGVYIDYRRFDALNITPRYEFGYGLTYTTFDYSDLNVYHTENGANASMLPPSSQVTEGGVMALWDVLAVVQADVQNSGANPAFEVPQLYIGLPGAPVRQLRGFEKIYLQPGESRRVTFELTRRDLSIWSTTDQSWLLQRGMFSVYVGASSRDIRLTTRTMF